MSTDISIKPAATSAASIFVAPTSGVRDAVPTELAAPKAVTAIESVLPVRAEPPRAPATVSHQILIDKDAAAIVFQTVDERTNEVISQFPDDAILRRRAYFEALDRQKDAPTPVPTDHSI